MVWIYDKPNRTKPKLHENILRYYRWNLFKEIEIAFNYGVQTTSESAPSFSFGVLLKIDKCFRYPCFQFFFSISGNIGSLACVAWRRVSSPAVGYFSCHSFDSGRQYPFQAHNVGHRVEGDWFGFVWFGFMAYQILYAI